MVATSQRHATEAGVALLRAGGNAADAAIAAAAALAVTEPCSTGLGGDAFALYYDASAMHVTALNGSGRSPAALRPGCEWSPYHANTVTVPGACAAWCDLIEKHGSKPMREILAPAIWLAEQGFEPAPITRHFWELGLARVRSRELALDGSTFRNPGMAHTLRAIADGGKDAFYRGPIARSIVRAVRTEGGALSEEDLAAHVSTWDAPISTVYRDVRVWECPPNGQGIVALMALNTFGPLKPSEGVDRWHLLIESLRWAFREVRYYVGESPQPVPALLEKRYYEISRRRVTPPGPISSASDTVYLCAVDAAGNACSFINSNYMGFGTGIVPTGCGFSLQNRGYNFSRERGHPNELAPLKRPYHTIMPGMITRPDGSLYGPFGVMGGFMQPQGHVQVVVAMIDDGLDPQAALDRPRFCIDRQGVALESGTAREIVEGLAARGHNVREVGGWGRSLFGRGQIIVRERDGALVGGSDGRDDGCAMGV